jgi:predicted RNA-binding Zn-ribbon protein involved in translation (DUF1610 family)
MTRLVQSTPSVTAVRIICPQCGQAAHIKRIEPDPMACKENNTFQCEECGLPRTYSIAVH